MDIASKLANRPYTMSTFTHTITIQAVLDNGTVMVCSNTHEIENVLHVSHGQGNMEEDGFGGVSGFPAGEPHDYFAIKMTDGDGRIEWDNGDTQPLTTDLLPNQSLCLLSNKSYDRSTTAGDATVTNTDLEADTVTSGRGCRFEYIILNTTSS
jgi:hypothetical protein